MPSNLVKSPSDERHWRMAKQRAAEEGHAKDWPYVVGIFERMKGGHKKTAAINPLTYLKDLWHNASGHARGPIATAKRKAFDALERASNRAAKGERNVMDAAGHLVANHPKGERFLRKAYASMVARGSKLTAARGAAESSVKDLAEADAKQRSARKKLVLGAGGLAATGLAAKHLLSKKKDAEEVKTAEDKNRGVNWKRLALMGAGMGLLVGGAKGYAEEAIKNVIKKRGVGSKSALLKRLGMHKPEKAEQIGRSIGRGVTSAGGGMIYATGTALGMKGGNKNQEDKK